MRSTSSRRAFWRESRRAAETGVGNMNEQLADIGRGISWQNVTSGIEKITGAEAEYKSPTDMGVNRAGFGIIDDDVCREAACQEIIRRYLIAECDFKKGKIGADVLERQKLLMDDMGLKIEDRPVVVPAREYAEMKLRQPLQS